MKIRPVILCGGSGTIDFGRIKKNTKQNNSLIIGNWTLLGRTLEKN